MGVNFQPGVVPNAPPLPLVNPTDIPTTTYVVEVVREHILPTNILRGASLVDVVRPGGTVTNIGAGPVLPNNPYEGQVWILT